MLLLILMNVKGMRTCLLVLLMLQESVVTSQRQETLMYVLTDKRFDVAPRDVITRTSATRCAVACLAASWCVSANLFTGDGTCQLLSEEVSYVATLETAIGWIHLREFAKTQFFFSLTNIGYA